MKNEFTRENAHEWAELDHVFLVQDEPVSGTGDYFDKVFRTLEEANEEARDQWGRLTERERKTRHIWVGRIDRDDLDASLASEGLPVDWTAYTGINTAPGAFDSTGE